MKRIEASAAGSRACAIVFIGAGLLICAFGARAIAGPLPLKEAPVPNWPRLDIRTHYVVRLAMRGACLQVPAGTPIPETSLNGCARPDFWRGVCDVFIDVRHVTNAALLERQTKRCRGYDEQRSDEFADALRAWRQFGENRFGDMLDFDSMMFIFSGACAAGDTACIEVR